MDELLLNQDVSDAPPKEDKFHTVHDRDLKLASALVEHFDPIEFGKIFVEEKWRSNALASLSEHCDEVEHGNKYHWHLRTKFRRQWLNEYNDRELFLSLLEKLDNKDPFTQYLKIGLSGQRLSDELKSIEASFQENDNDKKKQKQREHDKIKRSESLHAMLKAARIIDMLGIATSDGAKRTKDMGVGENPSEARLVRREIERNAALDALDSLANKNTKRLFGRQREIRKLINFRNTDLSDTRSKALRVCVITGVGGAGKSALLARYIYRQRRRSHTPPIIYFDFDRSSLTPDNHLNLTFEFTRQLALYVPELDLPLVQFRRSDHSENCQILCESLGKLLLQWPNRMSAVTLVIDTFEEVALQGPEAVRKILDWLRALRDFAYLGNLHVIIAGREMPGTLVAHKLHILYRLRICDLHKDAAKLLLTSSAIDSDVANKAVDTFGGNPLVLHMFARFCDDRPDDINALLSDNRELMRSAPSGELALYFLVERILVRIKDEKIKSIASPGLTLRYITRDLIRHVLAEPCGLGVLSDKEAQELFDQLANHVWLVRKDGDRLLGNHRDLRRMMLPGVLAKNLTVCEEISRKAVHYFSSNPPGLLEEDAWIEAAYHRGFLGEYTTPKKVDDARKIINRLGADLYDWPTHTINLIMHTARMSERFLHSEDHRKVIESTHGIFSRANQAAELAHQLPAPEETSVASVSSKDSDQLSDKDFSKIGRSNNSRTVRFLFQHGQFDQISPWTARVMLPLFRHREALAVTHYWRDEKLLHKTPWLAALAHLVEPDYGLEADPIIPPSTIDAVLSTPRQVAIDTTFELFYMLAIAELVGDRHAISALRSHLDNYLPCFSPPISNGAQLQILQISANSQEYANVIGERDVITIENCKLLQWRSLLMPFDENSHPDTKINRHRHKRLSQLLPRDNARITIQQLSALQSALNEHSVEVLGTRGLNQLHSLQPVLYAPIRFALSSVPARDVYHSLVKLSEMSNLWPTELTPRKKFVDNGVGFNRLHLNTIIETADRCNLLEYLLQTINEVTDNPLMRDELCLLTKLNGRLTGHSAH